VKYNENTYGDMRLQYMKIEKYKEKWKYIIPESYLRICNKRKMYRENMLNYVFVLVIPIRIYQMLKKWDSFFAITNFLMYHSKFIR
jgi:hypothetical protein